MLERFCRACSETVAASGMVSTDSVLAAYNKAGLETLSVTRLALFLGLPASETADQALERALLYWTDTAHWTDAGPPLGKDALGNYTINRRSPIWTFPPS